MSCTPYDTFIHRRVHEGRIMPDNKAQPTVVTLRVAGDHVSSCEYVISSPSHPLYQTTLSTCPFDMCNMPRETIRDAENHVFSAPAHLQPIWDALLESGHFLMGQFGHEGVIIVWTGGSTAPCDVQTILENVNMPAGMVLQLESV